MAKLIISRDAQVIQEVEFGDGRITIGRHPASDIVIAHSAVSGRHAAIDGIDGQIQLQDLGSSNGTFVNGQRISRARLADGDRFTIAGFELAYLAAPAPVRVLPVASIEVVNGAGAGRTLTLHKPLTTLGSPGVLVVAVARHDDGFYIALVNGRGESQLNGQAIGATPCRLADGDMLDITGTRMRFTTKK